MTNPTTPSAPADRAVLDLLKSKGSVTSVEAAAVLRSRSLPRRILTLKQHGWPIKREMKTDPLGQRYARYSLDQAAA